MQKNIKAANEEEKPLRVIMIGAHPDDAEIKGGGTAALWAQAGAEVLLVSLTNGDAGHHTEGGGALAKRRAAEARRSAKFLGASWLTLDFHDGELVPDLNNRETVIRAIRKWQADIVITHRPNDYHPDHRYTGQLVQDAAFLVTVPNACPDTPHLRNNPIFLYFFDRFKKPAPFNPDVVVDVTPVIDKKLDSMDSMESQVYEWLPWIDGHAPEIPEKKEERMEWLKGLLDKYIIGPEDDFSELLLQRYSSRKDTEDICYIEAFELCEYGSQPESREKLWEMFPW